MKVVDKGTVRDTSKIESGITYNIGPINHKQRQLELPHTDTLYIRTHVGGRVVDISEPKVCVSTTISICPHGRLL